jgi:hypothetical protein
MLLTVCENETVTPMHVWERFKRLGERHEDLENDQTSG